MSKRTAAEALARGYAVVLLVAATLFAYGYRPAAPRPEVERAAKARLKQCASGYLGRRLDRIERIVWRALPESSIVVRARTALPDTVYLHPAWRADEWTVAHEMLHVAIGRPGHPDIPFRVCGLTAPEHVR